MQRRDMEERRKGAERDAAQPIAGQPRHGGEEDPLEQPERVPSFLSARELQARNPAKNDTKVDPDAGERHASASFRGEEGEPTVSDDDPPRGARGLPEGRTLKVPKKK
jgi:hypothetical protein